MTTPRETRRRAGAVWRPEEDARLLAIADLPPRAIATAMARSWDACRRRLRYLRAGASPAEPGMLAPAGRPRDR